MSSTETATFGTGCFWCTEAIYKELNGVISVMPGYSGGHTVNPTYKEVCNGETGHAECTQIVYDPSLDEAARVGRSLCYISVNEQGMSRNT